MGMAGGEEPEMTSQTGGAKSRRGRKQRGGAMTEDQKQKFLISYNRTNNENERPNNNKSQNSDRRIRAILEQVGVGINSNIIGEMDLAISEAKQLIKNRNNAQLVAAANQLVANNSGQLVANPQLAAANPQLAANNSGQLVANAQRVAANAQRVAANAQQAQKGNQSLFSGVGFGGKKPKSKAKKAPKKTAPKKK
jgi:hypothetical protein